MSKHENTQPSFDFESFRSQLAEQRKKFAGMTITGERFTVPRDGGAPVDTILYRPKQPVAGPLPVLFNLHGGAWVGGDAVLMDSFCSLLASEIPALIVNVNYIKADIQPIPYQIHELCDTVLWFAGHADDFGVDKARFAIGGHSAGAQISAGAAVLLKALGFALACQMLVYPFVDFTISGDGEMKDLLTLLKTLLIKGIEPGHRWLSPLQASDEELTGVAPAIIIISGQDELKPMGVAYAKRLIDCAVPVKYKEYPKALHGFLEVNRPEYEGDPRRSPEQLAMTLDCERYLIRELRACLWM